MGTESDLATEVKKIFSEQWTLRDGQIVPEPESLKLGNDGINLEATILYADLTASTVLVDSHRATFAAEVYKAYLRCAARIIKNAGGKITSYDGDRIMAVFIGDSKNSTSAKVALQINYAVTKIVNPALSAQYGEKKYTVKQTVGIDTSTIMAARIGVKNDNDIVWTGRAANYAAKLSNLSSYRTYITKEVYNRLTQDSKYSSGVDMWTPLIWTAMNNHSIYASNYTWKVG